MDASSLLPGVPLVHSPFFEAVLAQADWDDETRRVARDLNRDGFAVIDFPEPELAAIADEIEADVFADLPWARWRSGELYELRVAEAWRTSQAVRRIAANPTIIALLSTIYGRRAFPFQTLNFGSGSEQSPHADLVHFASAPEHFMCGVWLALEDVAPNAGGLVYFPGSHKWPVFYNEHIGRAPADASDPYQDHDIFERVWTQMRDHYGVEPRVFLPRKGQALIWAAGLHHGGSPHTDRSRTRRSQVTHYFFAECAYWTPLTSDPFAGRIAYRTGMRDIASGAPVVNAPGGAAVPADFLALASGQAPAPSAWRRAARRAARLLGR